MSKVMRSLSALAATALTAAMVTSCTTMTEGDAAVADLNATYTGPSLVTGTSNTMASHEFFAPGAEVRVGSGDNAVTCTAGWVLSENAKPVGFLLAGQCGRSGMGARVVTRYKDEDVIVGRVMETSYSDPYDADTADVALVQFVLEEGNEDVLFGAFGVPSLPVAPFSVGGEDVGTVNEFADRFPRTRLCWMTEFRTHKNVSFTEKCGRIVDTKQYTDNRAGDGKITLEPFSEYGESSPTVYGAPVYIVAPSGVLPVGILTDQRDGNVVVDTFGTMLDAAGLQVANQAGT